jgi:hypothetical protein
VKDLEKIIFYDYRGFDPAKMDPEVYFLGKEVVKDVELGKPACGNDKDHVVGNTDFNLIPTDTDRVPKVTDGANDNVLQLKDNHDIGTDNVIGQKTTMTNLDNFEDEDKGKSDKHVGKQLSSAKDAVVVDTAITENTTNIYKPKVITIPDYDSLAPIDCLTYDKRTNMRYIKDLMVLQHPIISLIFKKSFLDPLFLRILQLIFALTLQVGINAMLYTDGYLDARKDSDIDPGFFYSLTNELDKTILGLVLSSSLYFVVCLSLGIPRKKQEELNEALGGRDIEKIKAA